MSENEKSEVQIVRTSPSNTSLSIYFKNNADIAPNRSLLLGNFIMLLRCDYPIWNLAQHWFKWQWIFRS